MRASIVLAVLVAFAGFQVLTSAQAAEPANDKQRAAAAAAVEGLVKDFNAHDAKALAARWAPDAVHVAKASGATKQGRDEIGKAYAALFKADPKAQLSIKVFNLRLVTPDVASLDCTSDVQHTNGEVTRSEFSAVLVRRDGAWLIDQVSESDLPVAPVAADHLHELNSLIGTWVDQQKGYKVTNDFRWAAGGNFITRTYAHERNGETVREGMQIIGWDPARGLIRSWTFDGDGSFGQGTWQRDGNKWTVKMAGTMADGSQGAVTQVIQVVGNDKVTMQMVDREVDGKMEPNGQLVTLVRETSTASTQRQ